MIVKNEQDYLAGCLASVQGLVSEIIIGDTGSTDSTITIAKQHNAMVLRIPWADDFSAAKNNVLRHATGSWILWLDADEILPPEEHGKIRTAIAAAIAPSGSPVDGFRTPIKNFVRLAENEMVSGVIPIPPSSLSRGANGYFISTTIRLFRNTPSLFFVGKVHELLNKDNDLEAMRQSDITILHYGYLRSKEDLDTKKELYLRIGKEKAVQEKTPESYAELSALYADRQQYHLAKAAMVQAIKAQPSVLEWYYTLAVIHKRLGEYGEAERVLRHAISLDQKSIRLYTNPNPYAFIFASLGEIYARKKQYTDALFLFDKAKKQGHPNTAIIDEACQKCKRHLQPSASAS